MLKYTKKDILDKMKRNKIFSAFTLAEVLITLGIIGIVAEMTIPTLLSNAQNAEYIGKMKKNYSIMSQAYMQIANDSGNVGNFANAISVCTNGTGGTQDNNCFRTVFEQKLNFITSCDQGSSRGVCFPSSPVLLNRTLQSDNSFRDTYASGLILKDGTHMLFSMDSNACSFSRGSLTNECGWIAIDVNGLKNPNTWGRDLYAFIIYRDRIRPLGSPGDGYGGTCTSSGVGQSCAFDYMYAQ